MARSLWGKENLTLAGYVESVCMHDKTWGTFLEPDLSLIGVKELHQALGIPIESGHRADFRPFAGTSSALDQVAARIAGDELAYEDQCSAQHYVDVFRCIERSREELSRVVDVGVFMGGSSVVFAGCAALMGLEVDLVDAGSTHLQFTYERIRRLFPESLVKLRMFHGDLPTYVHEVLSREVSTRALIHHDGAHDFNQVVKDLSSLYFARDRVHSLAIQDTHLRGNIRYLNFVDAAVFGVFGIDVNYEPLGSKYEAGSMVTFPNRWNGNYFLADTHEGMLIPFSGIEFKYPHEAMTIDDFLPVKDGPSANATQGARWSRIARLRRQTMCFKSRARVNFGPQGLFDLSEKAFDNVTRVRAGLRRGGFPELTRRMRRKLYWRP